MLQPVRTAAPAVFPISLEEAKRHLVVVHSDDDHEIELIIAAACARLDGRTGIVGRALVNQTWRQDYPAFSHCLRLPLRPVSSVTSDGVKYYDTNNVQQTLSTSVWQLLTDELGPRISLKPLQTWPSTYGREDAVSVTFIAGYGTKGEDVPPELRIAALMLIGHMYDNREAVIAGNISAIETPMGVDALIAPYRCVGF